MIDIHCHILPGVDDGSDSIEKSLKKIETMYESGVKTIVFTPHFMRGCYENTTELMKPVFDDFKKKVLEKFPDLKLFLAAEIYITPKTAEDVQQNDFGYGESNYVLVESSMSEFPDFFEEVIFNLLRKGFRPVLAHPERYATILNNPEKIDELIHKNVYMQVNAGSLGGHYGADSAKLAWKMIRQGKAHFMASDDHCRSEEYSLIKAAETVRERIDEYTVKLLTEINPGKMLRNEKIDFFYLELEEEEEKSGFIKKIIRKLLNL
ncbi:MAG: hypothetical protein CSB55_06095 [Candidatus Cloacimonadota bacterium]|nr:MAG: hypothetical protein CSB55_06095 [Candidatus Cloacimonadota bacterium]